MRMCREILSSGEVLVRRPDAEEIKSIRTGQWSYDQVIEESERLELECKSLYQTSSIPNCPDINKIDELIIDLHESFLGSSQSQMRASA